MKPLTYRKPGKVRKPFAVGETVIVRDRDLSWIGETKIKAVSANAVVTEDGRDWRADNGWYIGPSRAYPFPSIGRAVIAEARRMDKRNGRKAK